MSSGHQQGKFGELRAQLRSAQLRSAQTRIKELEQKIGLQTTYLMIALEFIGGRLTFLPSRMRETSQRWGLGTGHGLPMLNLQERQAYFGQPQAEVEGVTVLQLLPREALEKAAPEVQPPEAIEKPTPTQEAIVLEASDLFQKLSRAGEARRVMSLGEVEAESPQGESGPLVGELAGDKPGEGGDAA